MLELRESPFPRIQDGTTVALTTDTHIGEFPFVTDFANRVGRDLDSLKDYTHGYIHAGDAMHWSNPSSPEDEAAKNWYAARRATGKPLLAVAGNHDLASYVAPKPHRTDVEWAAATLPGNPVQTMGDMKVIGVNPDDWIAHEVGGWGQLTLSQSKLDWLDSQLTQAGNTPCWVVVHSAPDEQYNGTTAHIEPIQGFADVIGSHNNAVGVLSGHLHALYTSRPNHCRTTLIGGRKVFTVNGAAGGGRMNGIAFADHQFKSPAVSTFITYEGDSISVRWRSHLDRRWDFGLGKQVYRVKL